MTDSSPKKSPGPEARQLVVAAHDADRPRDDDVQAVADLALVDDELPGCEVQLAGRVGEARPSISG